MIQKPKHSSVSDLIRLYRRQTISEHSGKPLSQEELAIKLYQKTGTEVSRSRVSSWEQGKSYINPDDRNLIIALVTVLVKNGGLKSLEDANLLLETGKYQTLNNKEIAEVNPDWATRSKSFAGKDSESESLIALNIESREQLPISLHAPKPGPGSAPPLSSLVVGRDEDLKRLKENLGIKGGNRDSIQILAAIKGWPGVGKTTIASALAHDADTRAAFPDGVLWVSLGTEPNLLSGMATWGRALGTDELLKARTLEEAQTRLAALLQEKRMLLIIDDVWKPEHAFPFMVGGHYCSTLITTRLDGVANALAPAASNIYRLRVLKDEDALTLLGMLAPTVVEQYPHESLVLVQELEGLPLALQVAGRLLNAEANRGFGIAELINELRDGAKLLEAQAPYDQADLVSETTPTIAALLQKSLDRLDVITRDCFAYLGVFAPKPATFGRDAMSFIWQIKDPNPIIQTLVDRGLLEYVKELDRYQAHAILVMLAKSLLVDDEK